MHACGLAPADWALCRGLFPGEPAPGHRVRCLRHLDAVGDGVTGVTAGDLVFGTADFASQPNAGAADHAIMDYWFAVPRDWISFRPRRCRWR